MLGLDGYPAIGSIYVRFEKRRYTAKDQHEPLYDREESVNTIALETLRWLTGGIETSCRFIIDCPDLCRAIFFATLRQKFFQKLLQPNPKFTLGCDKSSFKNQSEVKTLSPYPFGANLWPQEACRKLEPFLCSIKI